jgi:sec-independent protein translocase protein TatC
MATRLKPIGHEERLSIVEHLDELRTRIIICVVTFVIVGGLCFWQDDAILDTINRPLAKTTFAKPCDETRDPFEQSNCWQQAQRRLNEQIAASAGALARTAQADLALRAQAQKLARAARAAALATPRASPKRPVTLGVGEPFTATLTVAAYAALLISLPLLLYQLYAFVLPAFSPTERQVALPLMLLVPFLFAAGVVFAYYVVLPAAVNFLQNFNDENYDILLQARDYYRFAIMVLAAMGLLFQMPIVILAVTRMGILTTRQLRRNRRYAILVIAVIAMLMPGQDPVTMLSMMLPMIVLYEGSILLASLLDRRAARARAREQADGGSATSAELSHLETDND